MSKASESMGHLNGAQQQPDEARLAQIEEQLKTSTEQQKLVLDNLDLRVKLLEAKLGQG